MLTYIIANIIHTTRGTATISHRMLEHIAHIIHIMNFNASKNHCGSSEIIIIAATIAVIAHQILSVLLIFICDWVRL